MSSDSPAAMPVFCLRKEMKKIIILAVLVITAFGVIILGTAEEDEGLNAYGVSDYQYDDNIAYEMTTTNEKQLIITETAMQYTNPYELGYFHLCEGFAGFVYRQAGLDYRGSCCASSAREQYAKTKGIIPVGAIIYSSPHFMSSVPCECGRDAGHVAIYIGDGLVLGSQDKAVMDIDEFIRIFGYGGWSFNISTERILKSMEEQNEGQN